MAQSLPTARQGLGEPQQKGARVLAPRINPPHAQKTLQSGLNSPDRLLIMSRANEESVTKSKRGAAAWKKNRDNIKNRNLTNVCPGWLKPKPSKQGFDLIHERVVIVKRIFSEAADQGMGANLISRRLNKERVPTVKGSNGWSQSYILKILKDKSVLGQFQPHLSKGGKRTAVGDPIPNYYPAI